MSSERARKAAYRKVAELLTDPDTLLALEVELGPVGLVEILRIRDAMQAAGNVPPLAAEGLVLQ